MPRQSFPGSSSLSAAAYDEQRQELTITFKSGRSYTYTSVPPDVYEQLSSSDSPGKFWHASIKDAYS